MESRKPIHTLILDTGCIITNNPPISTLLNQSETLLTVPEILTEIRDSATRSLFETTIKPFLSLRSPTPASVKFVTDFARRTGDLAVLSRADVLVVALTYEVECERNGGDWRLRRVPGQKGLNGSKPMEKEEGKEGGEGAAVEVGESGAATDEGSREGVVDVAQQAEVSEEGVEANLDGEQAADEEVEAEVANGEYTVEGVAQEESHPSQQPGPSDKPTQPTESTDDATQSGNPEPVDVNQLTANLADASVSDDKQQNNITPTPKIDSAQNSAESQESSDSDSDGWITPKNLKKKQAHDASAIASEVRDQRNMQVGVLTTDFAMQNVILQINLNLISPQLTRIRQLRTYVLRCHACFQVMKDMSKQFCSRCGQASLTRVACSTSANGQFKLHLKKNMQWSHRGDRYSIPKPVHGASHGRMKGGGKGGWGNELILAEDQKEYQRAVTSEKRSKARDLMDEDYLPSILTGDRSRTGGRIRVGAGRNVNAKKR